MSRCAHDDGGPSLSSQIYSDFGFSPSRRTAGATLTRADDKSEAWPFQGGTNATVFRRMATILQAEGKREFLHLYWYVGRDQLRPLNGASGIAGPR